MSTLAQFANPLDGMMVELSLGRRGSIDVIVPDGDECDHIASLLRKGCTMGIGILQWDLRTAPGVRFPQDRLDAIAGEVEEGIMRGTDPCWRVDVRR
jgi:hypothetical protein